MARIIIADDDDLVAQIVLNTLFAVGHAAGRVADGTQALAVIRRELLTGRRRIA